MPSEFPKQSFSKDDEFRPWKAEISMSSNCLLNLETANHQQGTSDLYESRDTEPKN